jgi:hypothetical protein
MSEPSPDTFAAAIALIGLAVDPEATSARLAELQKGVEALARHRPSSMPTVRRATRQNTLSVGSSTSPRVATTGTRPTNSGIRPAGSDFGVPEVDAARTRGRWDGKTPETAGDAAQEVGAERDRQRCGCLLKQSQLVVGRGERGRHSASRGSGRAPEVRPPPKKKREERRSRCGPCSRRPASPDSADGSASRGPRRPRDGPDRVHLEGDGDPPSVGLRVLAPPRGCRRGSLGGLVGASRPRCAPSPASPDPSSSPDQRLERWGPRTLAPRGPLGWRSDAPPGRSVVRTPPALSAALVVVAGSVGVPKSRCTTIIDRPAPLGASPPPSIFPHSRPAICPPSTR